MKMKLSFLRASFLARCGDRRHGMGSVRAVLDRTATRAWSARFLFRFRFAVSPTQAQFLGIVVACGGLLALSRRRRQRLA